MLAEWRQYQEENGKKRWRRGGMGNMIDINRGRTGEQRIIRMI